MLGALVVAPLLPTWAKPIDRKALAGRLSEALALLGAVLGASVIVFLGPPGASRSDTAFILTGPGESIPARVRRHDVLDVLLHATARRAAGRLPLSHRGAAAPQRMTTSSMSTMFVFPCITEPAPTSSARP